MPTSSFLLEPNYEQTNVNQYTREALISIIPIFWQGKINQYYCRDYLFSENMAIWEGILDRSQRRLDDMVRWDKDFRKWKFERNFDRVKKYIEQHWWKNYLEQNVNLKERFNEYANFYLEKTNTTIDMNIQIADVKNGIYEESMILKQETLDEYSKNWNSIHLYAQWWNKAKVAPHLFWWYSLKGKGNNAKVWMIITPNKVITETKEQQSSTEKKELIAKTNKCGNDFQNTWNWLMNNFGDAINASESSKSKLRKWSTYAARWIGLVWTFLFTKNMFTTWYKSLSDDKKKRYDTLLAWLWWVAWIAWLSLLTMWDISKTLWDIICAVEWWIWGVDIAEGSNVSNNEAIKNEAIWYPKSLWWMMGWATIKMIRDNNILLYEDGKVKDIDDKKLTTLLDALVKAKKMTPEQKEQAILHMSSMRKQKISWLEPYAIASEKLWISEEYMNNTAYDDVPFISTLITYWDNLEKEEQFQWSDLLTNISHIKEEDYDSDTLWVSKNLDSSLPETTKTSFIRIWSVLKKQYPEAGIEFSAKGKKVEIKNNWQITEVNLDTISIPWLSVPYYDASIDDKWLLWAMLTAFQTNLFLQWAKEAKMTSENPFNDEEFWSWLEMWKDRSQIREESLETLKEASWFKELEKHWFSWEWMKSAFLSWNMSSIRTALWSTAWALIWHWFMWRLSLMLLWGSLVGGWIYVWTTIGQVILKHRDDLVWEDADNSLMNKIPHMSDSEHMDTYIDYLNNRYTP